MASTISVRPLPGRVAFAGALTPMRHGLRKLGKQLPSLRLGGRSVTVPARSRAPSNHWRACPHPGPGRDTVAAHPTRRGRLATGCAGHVADLPFHPPLDGKTGRRASTAFLRGGASHDRCATGCRGISPPRPVTGVFPTRWCRYIRSPVNGGPSGPGWRHRPDPAGPSPATPPSGTCTHVRDSIQTLIAAELRAGLVLETNMVSGFRRNPPRRAPWTRCRPPGARSARAAVFRNTVAPRTTP